MRRVIDILLEDKTYILSEDTGHWLPNDEYFQQLLTDKHLKNFLEIGSFSGSGSTKFLGRLAKERGGHLFCIDAFQIPDDEFHRGVLAQSGYKFKIPQLYNQFLSNIYHYGLSEYVSIYKGLSSDFFSSASEIARLPIIDMCYVDGDHSYPQAKKDIIYCVSTFPTAIICGDDWSCEAWYKSIQRSVTEAAQELGKQVKSSGNFWWLV